MAKFPIQRAPEKLGVVPITAVRADLDVRSGGRELAGAIAGFGGAIANLGLRWDLMQASTQLNEAKMKAKQEHIRLMLALPGLEPDEHAKEYENSLKVQQGFTPTNRRAAGAYRQLLNDFTPQQGLNVKNATKAKLKDNERAVGFRLQQGAIRDGEFADYFKHLEVGKKLGVYSAEEVAKYKQSTIDGRERYVKLQTAQQLEQLEIQREEDRDEISKLIRAGQSADSAIEGSSLDEKEQFTWFERQRYETERRLGVKESEVKTQLEVQREKDRDKISKLIRLRQDAISTIEDSTLDETEQNIWFERQRFEKERQLKDEKIVTDQTRKHELLDMATAISRGEVTAQEVKEIAEEDRYGKFPMLDDAAFDEIRDAIRRSEEKRFESEKKIREKIVTDLARKAELLDMAAAINWPERQVTPQEVKKLALDGRYGTAANLDDAAYDEIRDAIRKAEEDKIPFTQREIEKTIGELITGAPSSVLGLPLPTLRTREDAVRHATNAFGRFVDRIPGVMDTINAKFPPEKRKSTPAEPKGTPAHDFDGELIGSYNPDGSITLNREGARRLYEIAGRDKEKARQLAEQNRYIIPNIKE